MKKESKFFIFIVLFCFYALSANAEITEVFNLDVFKEKTSLLNDQSLVIFDVDETLITPKEAFFRVSKAKLPLDYQLLREYFGDLRTLLKEEILKGWKEVWISKMLVHKQFQLMDIELPVIIQKLQNRSIPTIALTQIKSGCFGVIPSIEDWRSHQLKEFNIDFSQDSSLYGPLSFTLEGSQPSFKHGILFTDKSSKGEVLALWLEAVKWKPTLIVFIDDYLPNLQSVEALAFELRIPFIGFHYLEKELTPWELDEKLISYQIRYLAENGVWLNEDEASERLQDNRQ